MTTSADEAKANPRVQAAFREVANAAVKLHLSIAAFGADRPDLAGTVMALVPGLLNEAIEDGLSRLRANMSTADGPADRCARCHCYDCAGTVAEHAVGSACMCRGCTAYPESACGEFMPHERIALLAEQLGPLLSVWLGPRQQRRCLAVAHATHHALIDYDRARETPR